MLALLMHAGSVPQKVEIRRKLFLNDCYDHLKCDFIETVNVKTAQGRMLIVCDEEALIRDKIPVPSVALADQGQYIYGDCLVFGYDPHHPDDPFTDLPEAMQSVLMTAPVLVV